MNPQKYTYYDPKYSLPYRTFEITFWDKRWWKECLFVHSARVSPNTHQKGGKGRKRGRNHLSRYHNFLTTSRFPLSLTLAGKVPLGRHRFQKDMLWNLGSECHGGGEKCHSVHPAGPDYPASKVYLPAAPGSPYKSPPCWTSDPTGGWFIGWMPLPGFGRSLCLCPVIVITL